jgi:hypothetical protein
VPQGISNSDDELRLGEGNNRVGAGVVSRMVQLSRITVGRLLSRRLGFHFDQDQSAAL